jgi:hypothetical protein
MICGCKQQLHRRHLISLFVHCCQDINHCESQATKKGVQISAIQKQLDKLQKDTAKAEAEQEKLQTLQQTLMQVHAARDLRCSGIFKGVQAVWAKHHPFSPPALCKYGRPPRPPHPPSPPLTHTHTQYYTQDVLIHSAGI